jgi:hypothetical protein
VPDDTHDDHGQKHYTGNAEISHSVRCFEALENRPNLQADEDERENGQAKTTVSYTA